MPHLLLAFVACLMLVGCAGKSALEEGTSRSGVLGDGGSFSGELNGSRWGLPQSGVGGATRSDICQ